MRIAVMMIAVIGLLAACGNQCDKPPEELVAPDPIGAVASADDGVGVGTVASIDEVVQSNRVKHSDETTPDDEIAPPNGALADDEAASPSSMGQASDLRSAKRRMPALLWLRIYNASAIVRATLISTSPATGFDVDKDDAVLTSQFRVSEYLKGSGASEVTVRARRSGSQGTKVEALQVAMDSLASRDTSRDTHEAVLFLSESTSDDPFHFLRSGPYPSLHYTTYTLIWVWLPAKAPPAAAGASSDDSSPLFLMSESALGLSWPTVRPTTMSLRELRSEVAAVDALLAAGDGTRGKAAIAALANAVGLEVDAFLLQAGVEAEDGIEWYRECVIAGWRYELTRGDWPDKPRSRYEDEYPLASGAPAGTVIKSYSGPDGNQLIEGADKDLFKAVLIDDDDRRDNGFEIGDATGRPLPAGTYRYKSYYQRLIFIPCNFFPFHSYTYHKVVVTAPEGALHELFFDPVTLTQGQSGPAAATDTSNGVLKPATFTDANGASATIQSIEWQEAGTVKMTLSPHTALSGHILDIIELDGTVSLSLKVADATVDSANDTLSWSVPSQPWHDGDKLMVRIREGGK